MLKMKQIIKNILAFSVSPQFFVLSKFNVDKNTQYCNVYILNNGFGCAMKVLGNYILVQQGEFKEIIVLTGKGEILQKIDEGIMNLYSSIPYKDGLLIRNKQTRSLWFIDENLQMNEAIVDFSFKKQIADKFYSWNCSTIIRKEELVDNVWQTNISIYGKYINLRDEQQPNEIDSDLMGFENLLFVPLRGGQLLALDVKTGEKVWMLEQDISGQYAIIEDKIYKKNKILYEIDTHSGQVLRQKEDWSGFISAGPIWAYDDILIIVNILEGDVILLDRKTFEIKDKINIGSRIAHWKDNIIWHENKLYVLDLNNTLHIFENEK